ncbi:MAG TPA: EAL domain-containing protein [Burkholderiales bacterium]|nr:EAL domain-containing protein [Burkholderiales bacterium]
MTEPLRVLMLEDLKSDAELELRELRQLRRALEFRRVETHDDFLRALVEFRPDIILSDFSMPHAFDGLMALDLAREHAPGVPFVFVSGTIGEDRAIDALRRGATDYVVKDRLNRLVPVVLRALQEADERVALRRAELWRDGQNRILESIATGALLAESLRQLVLAMESQSPGMLCSILLLNTDGTRLRTSAAPSLPEAYNRAVDGMPVGPAVGSCGTAAWRGEQVIVADIATDPLWKDYRDLAAAHGLRACWSTPILSRDGTLLGTFANYFRVPREPSHSELELAASATHIARIALEKRRDETEILRAKERLDLALEASGVALWDIDVTSGRVYLSEHWARMLGYDARATVTTVPELAELAHPEDRQVLLDHSVDIVRGRRASYDVEYRVAARNGEWRWVLSRGKVVERAGDGRAVRVIGTSVDITAGKLQEQRIARLSRIHAVLSGINSAIGRTRDRQELFGEACRIAVEDGNLGVAWIGLLDPATLEVAPVAWAGLATGEITHLTGSARGDVPQGQGTIGRAIRERRPVHENDLAADPSVDAGTRQVALRLGFHSEVALPLLVEDRVAGTLSLLAREAGFFTDEEMKLLTALADDISFALEAIARREKLDYLSYYDALTDLPNGTLFIDRARQQMRARSGEALMVALVLVNLERFRNINETFGRHGGDELLKVVARRLEHAFQGKDYLARLGADTFGVVVRGLRDIPALVHVVENQLLGCFREPFGLQGTELRVAARAGIAIYPVDGEDADTLFKNAEAALKKARESGEQHLFYAAEMNARAAHALSLETRLRKAVQDQQFVLHYQPKIDLVTDEICGLEALIRWNDPETGLVPPMQFIPLLEETGMILEVGRWAIRRALSQRGEWRGQGLVPPRIAVNVSALQLQQRDFSDMVIAAVREDGGADALEVEVTESLLMKDVQASITKLSAVRERGVPIAMDDFGTGYSSLSYIARLPINSVKIDRSFIMGMAGGPHDMAIVTTIIALAHCLNLKVTAEGVETGEQSRLLKLLRCDAAQGYLFSKPLPAADIARLLAVEAQEIREPSSAPGPAGPRH